VLRGLHGRGGGGWGHTFHLIARKTFIINGVPGTFPRTQPPTQAQRGVFGFPFGQTGNGDPPASAVWKLTSSGLGHQGSRPHAPFPSFLAFDQRARTSKIPGAGLRPRTALLSDLRPLLLTAPALPGPFRANRPITVRLTGSPPRRCTTFRQRVRLCPQEWDLNEFWPVLNRWLLRGDVCTTDFGRTTTSTLRRCCRPCLNNFNERLRRFRPRVAPDYSLTAPLTAHINRESSSPPSAGSFFVRPQKPTLATRSRSSGISNSVIYCILLY